MWLPAEPHCCRHRTIEVSKFLVAGNTNTCLWHWNFPNYKPGNLISILSSSLLFLVQNLLSVCSELCQALMFIGPCIIAIVDEWKTILVSLAIFFTYYVLSMFRTLIYPSSGACDFVDELPRTPPKTSRTKSSNTQRTENKTTDVVIHQYSRKLLKMDILMSETCWAHNKWKK